MTPAQRIMVKEGLPAMLAMTAEERAAAWVGFKPIKAKTDEQSAFTKAREEARALQARLVAEEKAVAMKPLPVARTKPTNKKDLVGKRWDPRTSRWVPDLGDKAAPTTTEAPRPAVEGSAFELDAPVVLLKPAPRQAGTRAAELYAEMVAYVTAHPGATIGDVMNHTNYRKQDYIWDLRKGNVR